MFGHGSIQSSSFSGSSYTNSEVDTYISYLNSQSWTLPSSAELTKLDTFFTTLKTNSILSQLDYLHLFAWGTSKDTTRANVVNPGTFTITYTGTVTYTSGTSIVSDGSTGYFENGYTDSVSGINRTLNSAFDCVLTGTYGNGSRETLLTCNFSTSSNRTLIFTRSGVSTEVFSLNSSGTTSGLTLADDDFFAINRNSSSTQWSWFQNTSETTVTGSAGNSQSLHAKNLRWMATDETTAADYSVTEYRAVAGGAGLSSAQVTTLRSALITLLT